MPAARNENNRNNKKSDGTLKPTSQTGAPHRVGGFRYTRDGDRRQRSDAVADMHGYTPAPLPSSPV